MSPLILLDVGESSWFTGIEVNWNMDISNMTKCSKMSFDFIWSEIIIEPLYYITYII